MKRIVLIGIIGISTLLSLLVLLNTSQASALTGSQFMAGRIVDDAVFVNDTSMTADEIQAFLDAKVPTCDTNGTQLTGRWNEAQGRYYTRAEWGAQSGNPAPYVCLKNYVENSSTGQNNYRTPSAGIPGGQSAAQIIKEAATTHHISPKTLLILLQKEQSLVTDDWPYWNQYQAATGAYCPDTPQGCDPAKAGFGRQVREAARLFRSYIDNPSDWFYTVGANSILYNPNRGCGSSTVNVESRATAALYNYTPYQPNQAALDNLYGTGDGCSAYGNRNFWRMFNDWFGPTTGRLVRTIGSGALYLSDGIKRYPIPSQSLMNDYGFQASEVRFVSDQELNGLQLANPLTRVLKSESDTDGDAGTIYLISSGKRYTITSMSQFAAFNLNVSEIALLPLTTIQQIPSNGSNLSYYIQTPDSAHYKIEAGKKRQIFESSLASSLSSGNVSQISDSIANRADYGAPIVQGHAVVVGPTGKMRLYFENSGVQRVFEIPNSSAINCWKLTSKTWYSIPRDDIINNSGNANLQCRASTVAGSIYVLEGGKKYLADSNWPVSMPTSSQLDSLLGATPTSPGGIKPVVKNPAGALAVVEAGKRRPITTMAAFYSLGHDLSDIQSISGTNFDSIPVGAAILNPGTYTIEPNGQVSLITSNTRRRVFTSNGLFRYFGLQSATFRNASATDMAAYPSDGATPVYFKTSAGSYLVNEGTAYKIASANETHYGLVNASLPLLPTSATQYTKNATATRFVKSSTGSSIYYLENGTKRHIKSWGRVVQLGGATQIISIAEARLAEFPTGSDM